MLEPEKTHHGTRTCEIAGEQKNFHLSFCVLSCLCITLNLIYQASYKGQTRLIMFHTMEHSENFNRCKYFKHFKIRKDPKWQYTTR